MQWGATLLLWTNWRGFEPERFTAVTDECEMASSNWLHWLMCGCSCYWGICGTSVCRFPDCWLTHRWFHCNTGLYMGGTVVHQGKVWTCRPAGALWSLHVLPLPAWVFSGCSGFHPQSKDMQVRLTGDSKLPVGVSVNGCLSLCVSPVIDWGPIQGVPLIWRQKHDEMSRWGRFGQNYKRIQMQKEGTKGRMTLWCEGAPG